MRQNEDEILLDLDDLEEPPTSTIGDTVEIDVSGSDVELDIVEGDYEDDNYDTVKLNLDNLELSSPSNVMFEPTIELQQTELLDNTDITLDFTKDNTKFELDDESMDEILGVEDPSHILTATDIGEEITEGDLPELEDTELYETDEEELGEFVEESVSTTQIVDTVLDELSDSKLQNLINGPNTETAIIIETVYDMVMQQVQGVIVEQITGVVVQTIRETVIENLLSRDDVQQMIDSSKSIAVTDEQLSSVVTPVVLSSIPTKEEMMQKFSSIVRENYIR